MLPHHRQLRSSSSSSGGRGGATALLSSARSDDGGGDDDATTTTTKIQPPPPSFDDENINHHSSAAAAVNGSFPAPPVSLPAVAKDNDDDVVDEIRFGGVGRLYAAAAAAVRNGADDGAADNNNNNSNPTAAVLRRLRAACCVVVGAGGVGSWAAEAVARSGMGAIALVDLDDVCASNTNRQLPALQSTVGRFKVDVLADRVRDLSGGTTCVVVVRDFVTADNVHGILDGIENELNSNSNNNNALEDSSDSRRPSRRRTITAVVDAVDGANAKAALLAACRDRGVPVVVTCGGAAGLRHPQRVQVRDLTAVENDRLLAATRKRLRKHHDFPAGRSFRELQKGARVRPWHVDAVYSDELAVAPPPSQSNSNNSNNDSSLRQCDGALGTACFVTGTFGFLAASVVVERIALGQAPSESQMRRRWRAKKEESAK